MTEQRSTTRRFTWQSLGLWVGLTLVGFFLSVVVHFPAGFASATLNPQDIDISSAVTGFVFGAVSGLIIASLQWIVLKSWIPDARLWIRLNAVGFGLVHALGDAVPYMPLVLVGGGIMLGLAQFFALRHALSRPIFWIPVAAVAWYAGFQLGFALSRTPGGYPLIAAALIYGATTALALRVMTSNRMLPPANQPSPTQSSRWANMSLPKKVLLVILLLAVAVVVFVIFAGMMFGLG